MLALSRLISDIAYLAARRPFLLLVVFAYLPSCQQAHVEETQAECLVQKGVHVVQQKSAPLKVMIVQGDNHQFPNTSAGLQQAIESDEKARIQNALLNFHYAQKHGYDYRRYTFARGCSHPSIGPLHEYFCKIAILLVAMEDSPDVDLVWWLDTDALVRNMSLALPDFLERGEVTVSDCKGSGHPHGGNAAVYAWTNKRWGCDANTGSVVLRRSSGAKALLKSWWEGAMPFGTDQPPFNNVLVRHPNDFAIFAEAPFDNTPGQFVHHRCGNCDWLPKLQDIQEQIALENQVDRKLLIRTALAASASTKPTIGDFVDDGPGIPWVVHMEGKPGFELR